MRVLTLKRPWAAAVCHLGKTIENRSWKPTAVLGERIAIHAGSAVERAAVRWIDDRLAAGDLGITKLQAQVYRDLRGEMGVVAVATVGGWMERDGNKTKYHAPETLMPAVQAAAPTNSPWFSGPLGWVLLDVVALDVPVPCAGRLGLLELQPDVERAVQAEIAKLDALRRELQSPPAPEHQAA